MMAKLLPLLEELRKQSNVLYAESEQIKYIATQKRAKWRRWEGTKGIVDMDGKEELVTPMANTSIPEGAEVWVRQANGVKLAYW